MLTTNLACPIRRLEGLGLGLHYSTVQRYTTDRLGVIAQKAEKMLLNEDNK